MPQQGYTYEELIKLGAKPSGYSFEELQGMGAQPVPSVPSPNVQMQEDSFANMPPVRALMGGYEAVKDYLPSWSTALPIAGGIAGSPLGIPGMATGAVIGESLAQLGEYATGSPNAPQSGTESLMRHTQAGLGAAAGGAMPGIAQVHAETPALMPQIRNALSGMTRSFPNVFRNSETLMTRGLSPSDLEFQKHLPTALNELKGVESKIGPLTTIEKVNQAAQIASKDNERIASMIIIPQKDVVVPGSASVLKQAQVSAIPDALRMTNPAEYERLVTKINTQTSNDLTLGQLNRITVSGNKLLSPTYGKTTIDQMTADERLANALQKAQNDAARRLLYEGAESVGLGGRDALRKVKGRTASILHFSDALDAQTNKIVAQKTPMAEEAVSTIRRGTRAMNPLGSTAPKPQAEQDILTALRRWMGRSSPVKFELRRNLWNRQERLLPPPKLQLPETGGLHPDDDSFVRGIPAGPPYQSHEQMLTGNPQGQAVVGRGNRAIVGPPSDLSILQPEQFNPPPDIYSAERLTKVKKLRQK